MTVSSRIRISLIAEFLHLEGLDRGTYNLSTCFITNSLVTGDTIPRTARQKSAGGIYHIMLRGIDRTSLFFDDTDRTEFMDRLPTYAGHDG